jgi:hypothetical protein
MHQASERALIHSQTRLPGLKPTVLPWPLDRHGSAMGMVPCEQVDTDIEMASSRFFMPAGELP